MPLKLKSVTQGLDFTETSSVCFFPSESFLALTPERVTFMALSDDAVNS